MGSPTEYKTLLLSGENLLHLDLYEVLFLYCLPSFAPMVAGEKMGRKKTKGKNGPNFTVEWCPLSKRHPSSQN